MDWGNPQQLGNKALPEDHITFLMDDLDKDTQDRFLDHAKLKGIAHLLAREIQIWSYLRSLHKGKYMNHGILNR